jgi:hypothetical protein
MRRAVATATFVVCVVATFSSVLAAPATAAATGTGEPEFSLLGQPAWTPVGGDVTMRLDIPAGLLPRGDEVVLRMRVHNAITSSTAFDRSVDGDRLGNRIDRTYEIPVASLPRDAQGAVLFTFGLSGSATQPSFAVSRPGVYPVELSLRTDETLASFVTWIVVADPAVPAQNDPVRLASVWSVASPPVLDANGDPEPAVVRDLEPGGRLHDIARLLDDADAMPLTLQVGPETLESWQSLSGSRPSLVDGVASVKNAASRPSTQLLPAPYVPIDIPSINAAGLGSELPDQLRVGSDVLDRITGVTPSLRTMFIDPADEIAVANMRALLVDRVVVRGASLADAEPEDLLTPFALAVGDDTVHAVATSPRFEDLVTSDATPALRAQRLLAALSVLTFDRDEPSGVVLAPPLDSSADVETEQTVIAALRDHPYIRPVTLDDVFTNISAATDDSEPVVHQLAPLDAAPLPVPAAEYMAASAQLASLRSALGAQADDVVRGEQALRLALSSEGSTSQARTNLGYITSATEALQGGVSTTGRRVTVTARKADIPISFVNRTGKPVTVVVHLASEKLLFPDGADRTLKLAEGDTTERFAVEARASGTFPMTVTMTSPDGNLRIGGPQRVSVRSAVFSGAGAALTAGALLILALWWGNHFRRTRRARRDAAAT